VAASVASEAAASVALAAAWGANPSAQLRGRTFGPERLGSLEVDRQCILGRRPHRQTCGLLALEYVIDRALLTERQV